MYRDHFRRPFVYLFLGLLLCCLLFAFVWKQTVRTEETDADTAVSIRQTILDCALQCYVIEGAYPTDLEYMEENYGLIINHKNYVVSYEIFAVNLPPEVRVERKK